MSAHINLAPPDDEGVRDAILGALVAYNTKHTGINDYSPLAVTIRDDQGAIVGGLWGWTAFDWLFVELLVVPESLRGQGIGTNVLRLAESEAVARGCHSVWLDTFEFQARGFYERLGYSCFGELANYPPGYARYFLQKRLVEA